MHKWLDDLFRTYARAPVLGAAFGLMLLLVPIVLGAQGFLVLTSFGGLLVVVGGVVAAAFMSFPPAEVHKALLAIRQMFMVQTTIYDLHRDMQVIVRCATAIKEKGLRSFEASFAHSGINDPFIKYGMNMVISEYSADDIRKMMTTAAEATYERDSAPVEILETMTSHAPAFGMVGTLIGMIIMLCNLSVEMTDVGPSLAVAFLSTLYGIISARMVYMPAASHLQQQLAQQRFRHQLLTEGLALLAAGKLPMQIQDRLNSFLRPETHDYFDYFKSVQQRATAPHLKVAAS
jgi:chemotaxis protein MotA